MSSIKKFFLDYWEIIAGVVAFSLVMWRVATAKAPLFSVYTVFFFVIFIGGTTYHTMYLIRRRKIGAA